MHTVNRLDTHKAVYLDRKGVELIGLVEEQASVKEYSGTIPVGSMMNKESFNISNSIDTSKPFYTTTVNPITDIVVSKIEHFEGRSYGLTEERYINIIKLSDTILKEEHFKNTISKEFLCNKISSWVFRGYRNKQISENLSDFIIFECADAIKRNDVYFLMEMIEITEKQYIGNSLLLYVEKDYLDGLEETHDIIEKKSDSKYFESLRKQYQGSVLIGASVIAEREKAVALAYEECCLAVDIMKICSVTMIMPEYKIFFDIDKRVKGKLLSEYLIQDHEKPYNFDINKVRNLGIYIHDDEKKRLASDLGAQYLDNFIVNRNKYNTELSYMITNSIKRFSESLSKHDLNQRVAEIFTILESLLIKDENSSILDSITKYCPKLISKEYKERKEISDLMKRMYKVRSALVHHGLNKEFELEDLQGLQKILLLLLINLILMLDKHKNKDSILSEIDEAIMNAY